MKANDVMTTTVFSVNVNDSVLDAIEIMLRERISGLPVVGDGQILVGMITEGDLLRRAEIGTERKRPHWLEFLMGTGKLAAEYVCSHSRKVGDLMTRTVAVVEEDAPLQHVVDIMERKKVKRVPVVRQGRIAGIITRADLLKALAAKPIPVGKASDESIRRGVEAELSKLPWRAVQGHAVVHDGVVELWGFIFHEAERDAMRVAVENIPGVVGVRDNLVWVEPMTGTAMDLGLAAPDAASSIPRLEVEFPTARR